MSKGMKIYSKFEVTKNNGEKVKLRLQNLTEDLYEKVVDMMVNNFVKEEIFVKAAGVLNNPKALAETQEIYRTMYVKDTPALICCVDDQNGEIVGCNMLYKDQNEFKVEDFMKQMKEPEVLKMFRAWQAIESQYKIFDLMNVKSILSDAGLYVNPDFKGCTIVTELLKARKFVCEELNISVTGNWFSDSNIQKAAEIAGYETLAEVSYDELAKKADIVFTDVPKSCKLMVLKVNVK